MKTLKRAWGLVGWPLLVWAIVFVIATILISGGRYEKDVYLGVIETIFIFLIWLMVVFRKKTSMRGLIVETVSAAVVLAVLDFLVRNLLLEKNSFSIYKFWGTYAGYGAIILGSALKYWKGGVGAAELPTAPRSQPQNKSI